MEPIPDGFKGAALPLSNDGIANAASRLNIPVPAIKAIWEIEAAGRPFDAEGRPRILFESHIFHRLTSGIHSADHPTLSSRAPYKEGYKGDQYARLDEAMRLDFPAALKSCSWGAFQCMGFNHLICGYPFITDFVAAMCQSADNHLNAFVNFVRENHLDRYLRDRDWAKFAKGYNGIGFEKNKYDIKLAAAYAKHGGI